MKALITDFTKQLMHAMEITEHASLSLKPNKIMNVVINGMGSSVIAGNIAAEVLAPEAKIPVIINKDTLLPKFVSENTLVIIMSYSGDSEESINILQDAMDIGAHIICITSGGRMKRLAIRYKLDLILIPGDMPACVTVGFFTIQLLYIFNCFGILSDLYNRDLTRAIELINAEESIIRHDAKQTAKELGSKYIVTYSADALEPVAHRFRQQLNENSTCYSWQHTFPEMNHYEQDGGGGKNKTDKLAMVIFRNNANYPKILGEMDFSEQMINHYYTIIKEVYAKGDSILERILYLIHWCDWASYYMSERKVIDTIPEWHPVGGWGLPEVYPKTEFANL